MPVKPIPDGQHSLTPYLCIHGAAKAIEFYKQAFGATEMFRLEGPEGRIGHAELRIGDSSLMLADPCDMEGGLTASQTSRRWGRPALVCRRLRPCLCPGHCRWCYCPASGSGPVLR